MTREELEARVAELEHLNHRLANQIAGYGDRMQNVIGGVVKEARVAALREAVSDFESNVGIGEFDEQTRRDGHHHGHIEEAWGFQSPYMDWLRNRADNLEAS